MKPTVGRIVHCCPEKHWAEDPNTPPLTLAAIICGVFPDRGVIAVHYYLPDGANGACELPIEAESGPVAGAWWWPPRT